MRRLVLLRHGKSAWDTGASTDHDRPLEERGQRSARCVGEALAARGWVPTCVLTSDAVRATQTLAHLEEGLGPSQGREVRIAPELYLGGPHEVRVALRSHAPPEGTVLVIGHNPGLSEAASRLAGAPLELKTADAALFEVGSATWDALEGSPSVRFVNRIRSRDHLVLPGGNCDPPSVDGSRLVVVRRRGSLSG